MESQEQRRLDLLCQRSVPPEFILELFGVDVSRFAAQFSSWLSARNKQPSSDGLVDRYLFESFMLANRVEPMKFAAASLGMVEDSLRDILQRLPKIGLTRDYEVYPNLLDRGLEDDLISALPTTRFRTFGDHESFCLRIHADLETTTGTRVSPLHCWTSGRIQEYPHRFAKTFDSISLQPLSIRHQVLLDFGKPMNLAPDRCSKWLFAQNYSTLHEFLAGHRDPEDWEDYVEASTAHG